MLIHKATMGVLDRVWSGTYRLNNQGERVPMDRSATLADVDDPDEWWEIPSSGSLAKTIRRYYPWITPEISSNGELTGVSVVDTAPERETDHETLIQEARSRGYRTRTRVRPRGLMPFLDAANQDAKPGDGPSIKGLEPLKRKGKLL